MKPFVKYGIIGALLAFVWTLIGYVMGNETQEKLKWVGFAVMAGIVIYCFRAAILEYRQANEGFISFGKAYGAAFKTGLVMALVSSLLTYVYFAYINPEYIGFALEKAQEQMQEQGLSDEQIQTAVQMQAKFMTPVMMTVMGFVSSLIIYALISLIFAATMKKENPAELS